MSSTSFSPLRWCLFVAVCVLAPSVASAADPVEQLRDALKIDVGAGRDPDLQLAARRNKLIEAAILDMKTIAQLRRAYFMKQWSEHITLKEEKANKLLDIDRYRVEIGAKLLKAIRAAAAEANADRQLAVAVLIAEMAESEGVGDKDRFVRGLSDAVRGLATQKDIAIRQAGLSALGKITPDPAEAFPVLVQTLQKDEVGPRRIAAWALSDLVKNARYLQKAAERTDTIERAISAAVLGLRDADLPVRGYCLQALQESAHAVGEQYTSADELVPEGKKTVRPEVQRILKSFQSANGPLVQALADPRPNVRLAALQALDQAAVMRAKIIHTLQEVTAEKPRRAGVLKPFEVPDPLASIVERDWRAVARLLKDDDVRMRRGAISFLEQLGDQAEPAADEITGALADADRFVRLAAARTMRSMPGEKASAAAVRLLGTMLIDPDPDLSKAAAEALEALGPAAHDAVDWLAFIIANGDTDSRNWDTESRLAALKALVSVGGTSAQRAIPKVLTALADPDVRVRRDAAYALGRLGRPADSNLADQEVAALRKAMSDEDSEVRLNASEAILTIATPRKPL